MKGFGWFMLVVGLLLLAAAVIYDPTVASIGGAPGGRTINLSRTNERILVALVGLFACLIGTMMIAAGRIDDRLVEIGEALRRPAPVAQPDAASGGEPSSVTFDPPKARRVFNARCGSGVMTYSDGIWGSVRFDDGAVRMMPLSQLTMLDDN